MRRTLSVVAVVLGVLAWGEVARSAPMLFSDPLNELPDPTITDFRQAHVFNDYGVANVFDDDVSGASNGNGNVYATGRFLSGVADAFIDFDFGAATTIGGFVFYQRGNNSDTVFSFNMIFDDNADFLSPLATLAFGTTGTPDFTLQGDNAVNFRPDRQEFAFVVPISAQYVKWDVTASEGIFDGAAEMEFWAAVPEPTSLLLFGTGLAAVGLRRYRQKS